MLDCRDRSADAVADTPSTAVAQRLVFNIAIHLSKRLRQAAAD